MEAEVKTSQEVAQIAVINLIIDKQQFKYQLLVPFGVPWEEAFQVVDEFKLALKEMQRITEERLAAENAKEKEEVEAEVVDCDKMSQTDA